MERMTKPTDDHAWRLRAKLAAHRADLDRKATRTPIVAPAPAPIAARSDEAIERRALDHAAIVARVLGLAHVPAADHAATLAGQDESHWNAPGAWLPPTLQSTERTERLPPRDGMAGGTTYAERARAMGGARSVAASYPVLDGAPVGVPESLAAMRDRLRHARAEVEARHLAARAANRGGDGLPNGKRAKRNERARKHNARKGR